jgi:transcriptional regulator with XRE-family HTH domain
MRGFSLARVDTRNEIRDFLTSRRAKLKAADVGLPNYGTRRVPGLRREEVAVLAGVSVPSYTRLERGDLAGASDSVLDALARALQLDDAERAHLFDLARAAQPVGQPPRRGPAKHRIRPSVQQVLDAMTGAGAHIGNHRLDILSANGLGRALFLEMFDGQQRPNAARFVFLDPRAREFYLDWDRIARDVVATLRSAAGRNPTTATSPTSSASSRPAASSSVSTGPATTCASTSAASNTSTTPRWVTLSSTTSASKSSSTPA